MKVVLFCGGMGMRLREHTGATPKPMVKIGYRPILWHLMKYYAHFGHTEFILCLGWKGDAVKEYFLHYDECLSNDFVLSGGGAQVDLLGRDIQDWSITFVDTGQNAMVGERLKAVEPHLAGEQMFLANYADGLSDLPLPELIGEFRRRDVAAACLCVKPKQSFHLIDADADGRATGLSPISESGHWMNGGFFAFRREIFDYLEPGEDLVAEPFRRLIERGQLYAHRYRGFWGCMDTYKEMQALEDIYQRGDAPWEVWKRRERA
jgi:glucose-1-phosphate cytidylyltransferase